MNDERKCDSGLNRSIEELDNFSVAENEQKKRRRPKVPSPFTANLNALLKERGLSIRKAAEICGVAPSVVSQWTSGSQPTDTRPLLKLCSHLGADFQNLLTGVPSAGVRMTNLSEMFDIENSHELSGIFLIEVKKLRQKR